MKYIFLLILACYHYTGSAEVIKACYEQWDPYVLEEGGNHKGLSIELLRRSLASDGIQLQFTKAAYVRCVAEANTGRIDVVFFATPEEIAGFVFNKRSVAFWTIAAFVPNDSSMNSYTNLESFAGKRAGLVEGYIYNDQIDHYKGWTIDRVTDPEANLRKLAAKRLDVVIEDVLWGELFSKRNNLAIRALTPYIETRDNYIGFSKKFAAYADKLDAYIDSAKKDGSIDNLFKTATGKNYTELEKLSH